MSSWKRTKQFLKHFDNNLLLIHGKFSATATPSVTGLSAKGVASVARDSAGVYTLTLENSYQALVSASLTVVDTAAGVTSIAQVKTSDIQNGTVTVRLATAAGVVGDPAATVTIYFQLYIRDSLVE